MWYFADVPITSASGNFSAISLPDVNHMNMGAKSKVGAETGTWGLRLYIRGPYPISSPHVHNSLWLPDWCEEQFVVERQDEHMMSERQINLSALQRELTTPRWAHAYVSSLRASSSCGTQYAPSPDRISKPLLFQFAKCALQTYGRCGIFCRSQPAGG